MGSGEEFSQFTETGWDLTVGSVIGTRSFNWDDDDKTLTGVAFTVPWESGENTAICGLDEDSCNGNDPACSCGFYAYWDGSDDYSGYGKVSGVIEAYGKTVVGTRGFRAKKAKIVALLLPEPPKEIDLEAERKKFLSKFSYPMRVMVKSKATKRDDAYAAAAIGGMIIGLILTTFLLVGGFSTGTIPVILLGFLAAAATVYSGMFTQASFDAIDVWYTDEYCRLFTPNASYFRTSEILEDLHTRMSFGVSRSEAEIIAKKYPDARIFHDRREMMEAFPTGEK